MSFKKAINYFLLSFLMLSSVNSKELLEKDQQTVYKVLDARVYVNDFESVKQKYEYLDSVEKENLTEELGPEAKLICKSVLLQERNNVKMEELLKDVKDKKKRKEIIKVQTELKEAEIMSLFNEFKEYSNNNSDVSSYFLYHYREIEFQTVPYLSTAKQLELFKNSVDDYKKIEKMNPEFSENLFMLGTFLYMMPKVAGGDKDEGLKKIKAAIECGKCVYEKSSALILYSQLMFEEKKFEESQKYMNMAVELDPANLSVKRFKEMNEAGYSMFKADEYEKSLDKSL